MHVYLQGLPKQTDMYFAGKHVGEVKSAGGYIVGPRSFHPSRSVYDVVDGSVVAPIPVDIITKLVSDATGERVDASPNGPKIPRGKHDDELHRIGGKMRAIGMEEEASTMRSLKSARDVAKTTAPITCKCAASTLATFAKSQSIQTWI
jgi:hypothetical protein